MRAQLGFLALLLTLASAFAHLDRPRPVVSLHGVKLGMTRPEVVALLGEPCFGAQDLAAYDSDLEVGFEDGRVTWVVGFSLQVGGVAQPYDPHEDPASIDARLRPWLGPPRWVPRLVLGELTYPGLRVARGCGGWEYRLERRKSWISFGLVD